MSVEPRETNESRSVDDLVREAFAHNGGHYGRCPFCRTRYRWPGELEAHLTRDHPWELSDVA